MSRRYLGGVISATPTTPGANSASGMWTPQAQMQYSAAAAWPPLLAGQATYGSPGTYTWIAPSGVTSVSALCIGGGGGGGGNYGTNKGGPGGGLAYKNNITVVPGANYTVTVGAGGNGNLSTPDSTGIGGTSTFINTSTLFASGGNPVSGTAGSGGGTGATFYSGGTGANGNGTYSSGGGGGGAAGYAGNGGNGNTPSGSGSAGSGGGGGGGAGGYTSSGPGYYDQSSGGSGGGVGYLGQGASGSGGTSGGSGGSGSGGSGQYYGGGAGGGGWGYSNYCCNYYEYRSPGGNGAQGIVRIIWAGTNYPTRAYPSTNTGNV